MNICPFKEVFGSDCPGVVSEDDRLNCVTLQQDRAIIKINDYNKLRGTNVSVAIGSIVHRDCRNSFTNPNNLKAYKKRKAEEEVQPAKYLRSNDSQDFDYATHCLFCKNLVVNENGLRHIEVYRVSTWDFQNKIKFHCKDRCDKWADEVYSRIQFAIDLPAKDALYHNQCSINFRNNRGIPMKFRNPSDKNNEQKQAGRPVDQERAAAFQIVMDEFDQSDETLTVHELIERMRALCEEPYSPTKILDELKKLENIVITRNGKKIL